MYVCIYIYMYIHVYIYIYIYRLRQVAGGHRALRDPVLAQRPPPRALYYTMIYYSMI